MLTYLSIVELTICHTVIVVYSYKGVLFSHKNESIFPTHKSLEASHKQYMKQTKQSTRHDSTYLL